MRGEQRKCRHCGERFMPDPRNAHHQRYYTAPSCRAASRRASQAKWLAKPENREYYRGPEAVTRVQAWRRARPGYSRCHVSVTARDARDHAAELPIPLTPEPTPVAAPAGSPSQISCNAVTRPSPFQGPRYKISWLRNPLFWLAWSRIFGAVRYKRTSPRR